MPKELLKKEKSKKKPMQSLWNKLLSTVGKQKRNESNGAADKSMLKQAYLFKTEVKKAVRLREKLRTDYFNEDLKLYQIEINKILQPKLENEAWDKITKMDAVSHFSKIVQLLHTKNIALSQEEEERCHHYLKLIHEIVLLQKEMNSKLEIEPYYAALQASANLNRLLSHLYVLINQLTHSVDQQLSVLFEQYLRDELLEKGAIDNKGMSLQELQSVFQQISPQLKQEILDPQKIEALSRKILSIVGLQVASEVKFWARDSLKRYGVDKSVRSLGNAQEQLSENAAQVGEAPLPRVNIELGTNDLVEMLDKFKKLQKSLELTELQKSAVGYIDVKMPAEGI